MQVLKNNAYLLRQIGKTLAEQIRDMEPTGLRLSRNTIKKLRYGENVNCALSYLTYFAEYWQLSLAFMGYSDFAASGYSKTDLLNPNSNGLWRSPKVKCVRYLAGKVIYKYV